MNSKLEHISIEEYISEGVILIDRNGMIIRYNSRAKEILGLSGCYEVSHESGQLEPGDILIFADTSVGDDDGGLTYPVLNSFGVKCDSSIEKHGLLYIGKKNVKSSQKYKIIDINSRGFHEISSIVDGLELSCSIDLYNKNTVIRVGDKLFGLPYFMNISNVVIIRNHELLFYQMKGYTARKESLLDIMNGARFRAKEGTFSLNVEGTNIYSFHSENTLTQNLVCVATGDNDGYEENKLSNINGFTVISTIHPINIEGERWGALLTLTDVSTLEKSQAELDAALNELESLKRAYQSEDLFPEIVGSSISMKEVKRLASKAAGSDTSILILGESGTGKSFIARKIHEKSKRKKNPFIEINCCAIPKELLESELFGYEKGAFTGARLEGKKGIFELADGGTVFMDEIGDMALEMQAKLLLFIQKRSFFRVGGNKEISVNVRIITATNKNIEEEIRLRNFREDLYYRLNILPIYIEPLRSRREDIGLMIEHVMEKKNQELDEQKILSASANKILLSYSYPGNIREMENAIERAYVLCEGNIIYPEHLMLQWKNTNLLSNLSGKTLDQIMEVYEREVLQEALKMNDNNHVNTYRYLGIGKTSFYKKIKKYGL